MTQSTMQLTADQRKLICEALDSVANRIESYGDAAPKSARNHAQACRELRDLLKASDEVTV
jgi:hypothetical protein